MRSGDTLPAVPSGEPAHPFPVELPGGEQSPLRKIGQRLLVALALICIVAALAYIERDGYVDPDDGDVSLLDAFYYSTVSITTTGYGDVRPVSDGARLVTTLIVTPLRILFLILLVGTTLEILAERTRLAYRIGRWRKTLKDHTIVCGYGTKGRSAIDTLLGKGVQAGDIVVIDPRPEARARATAAGHAAVAGDASVQDALQEAHVGLAATIIVAVDRDDAAVLITLTARELSPGATIVAAVREAENVHLVRQGGADAVITSSETAGRLLGLASEEPATTQLLEDLLLVGEGLDLIERTITEADAGPLGALSTSGPVIAIVRDGEIIRYDNDRAAQLLVGDRVIALHSHH